MESHREPSKLASKLKVIYVARGEIYIKSQLILKQRADWLTASRPLPTRE